MLWMFLTRRQVYGRNVELDSHLSVIREKRLSPRRASAAGGSLLPLSPRRTQVRLTPLLYQVSGHRQIYFRPRGGLSSARGTVCGLNRVLPRLAKLAGHLPFQSSTRLAPRGSCPSRPSSAGRSANASLSVRKNMPSILFRPKTERRKNFSSSQSLASLLWLTTTN